MTTDNEADHVEVVRTATVDAVGAVLGAAVGQQVGHAEGAALGAVVGVTAQKLLERLLGPTARDRQLAALAHRVARLEQHHRGDGERFLETVLEVRDLAPERGLEFVEEVVQQVSVAGLEWSELPDGFFEAVKANFRRSLDVIDPAVLPSLARLTVRFRDAPLDRAFRSMARMLVDLDQGELGELRVLVEAALRARATYRGTPKKLARPLALLAELRPRAGESIEGVAWAGVPREAALDIPARGGVVAAMLRSGVAQDPSTGVPGPGGNRVLELPGTTLDALRDILELVEPPTAPPRAEPAAPDDDDAETRSRHPHPQRGAIDPYAGRDAIDPYAGRDAIDPYAGRDATAPRANARHDGRSA